MDNEYSIEFLQKEFKKHADDFDKQTEYFLKKRKKDLPDDPIPEHLTNPFNLPKALLAIIDEIDKLKECCK